MKKIFIILLVILINNAAFAQNINSKENILDNKDYYLKLFIGSQYNIINESVDNNDLSEAYSQAVDDIMYASINTIEDAVEMIMYYAYALYRTGFYYKHSYSISSYKVINDETELADIGFRYAKDNKSRLACSDTFINGDIKSRLFNKSLNIHGLLNRKLQKCINIMENYLAANEDKTGKVYLAVGLAYFFKDKLYNFDKVLYYFQKYTLLNDVSYNPHNIMSPLINLIAAVTKFQGDNIADFYDHAVENGYIDDILMTSGYADIYNDGFYHNFAIVKNNTQSILAVDEAKLSCDNENLYANLYYKIFGDNNTNDPLKYEPEHCTDYVYQGNLYVLPFNHTYYLINTTEVENNIKTISIKNPAYFNVNYGSNYNNAGIFRDDKTAKAQHGVSQMGNFSYKDNIVYEVKYDKEPQSPAGDVDRLVNMYDYSRPLTYSQIKDYVKDRNYEKAIMNSKYSKKDIEKYMEYLSSYSKYPVTSENYDLLFYDIGKKKPVYTVCLIDKNTGETAQYFIVDKKLKILNENLAKSITEFIYDQLNFHSVKIIYKEDNTQLIFLRRDGQVFIANIVDGKAGFNTFPAYYVKNKQKNIMFYKIKTPFNLYDAANIDCNNIPENSGLLFVCSSRELLSQKAYLEILYKEKQEKMDKNYYPEKIKQYYMISYDNMNNEFQVCTDKECVSEVFFKYEELFLK